MTSAIVVIVKKATHTTTTPTPAYTIVFVVAIVIVLIAAWPIMRIKLVVGQASTKLPGASAAS